MPSSSTRGPLLDMSFPQTPVAGLTYSGAIRPKKISFAQNMSHSTSGIQPAKQVAGGITP